MCFYFSNPGICRELMCAPSRKKKDFFFPFTRREKPFFQIPFGGGKRGLPSLVSQIELMLRKKLLNQCVSVFFCFINLFIIFLNLSSCGLLEKKKEVVKNFFNSQRKIVCFLGKTKSFFFFDPDSLPHKRRV